MIEADKRKAICELHKAGLSIRTISRHLGVDRKTVRAVIKQEGEMPQIIRKDKIEVDQQLLSRLYGECEGRIQRIYEKLVEQEGLTLSYPTLTKIIRELELGQTKSSRCGKVADEPGEMQHDTTLYSIALGQRKVPVVASLLYFRYSKMRYLKFYRSFNRFKMKCFFHEALSFFGYSGSVCIIDNTNLARLRGTGKDAIITTEMEQFGKQYGFSYVCHEKGHANRKAGNERSFWTVETNFLPGRSFQDLEDLNKQALEWATVRMANRPVGKSALIPSSAFEYEKPYLVKLPPYVSPPYLPHVRVIDQYGYLSFDGNYYWVPGSSRGEVKLLQYSETLKIYRKRECLVEYHLPKDGVKNQVFTPDGSPRPLYKPRHRSHPTEQEERKLRALDVCVDTYLNFALKEKSGEQKHKFIRQLFILQQRITSSLFLKTIKRAQRYRITDLRSLERIALLQMTEGDMETLSIDIDGQFQDREAYREGRLSDEVDLSIYEKMLEDSTDE